MKKKKKIVEKSRWVGRWMGIQCEDEGRDRPDTSVKPNGQLAGANATSAREGLVRADVAPSLPPRGRVPAESAGHVGALGAAGATRLPRRRIGLFGRRRRGAFNACSNV